jgi:outer membrane lipoprotein-sorting protein
MLRTHEAWKARQDAGEFKVEYLGKKPIEKVGGVECHVVKRICQRTETDSFEFGAAANIEPQVVAVEGFTEVTLYVDARRWLQLGSELYRTEPDGARVLVGAYFFRDVQLNPTFPPDTFTVEGLKK